MKALIVSNRAGLWAKLTEEFTKNSFKVQLEASFEHALQILQSTPPDLLILDATTDEENIRATVIRLLSVNAMVHTAVLTSTEPETFHEETEGLGILCSLPVTPQPQDLQTMFAAFEQVKF